MWGIRAHLSRKYKELNVGTKPFITSINEDGTLNLRHRTGRSKLVVYENVPTEIVARFVPDLLMDVTGPLFQSYYGDNPQTFANFLLAKEKCIELVAAQQEAA